MNDFVTMTRKAGSVERYHTERTLMRQSVAEHSYHVANIALELAGNTASLNLVRAALYHDIAEQYTGDIPAPVKVDWPDLHNALRIIERAFHEGAEVECNLTPAEQLILKWADALELLYYCIEERLMGNTSLDPVFYRGNQYFDNLTTPLPPANDLALEMLHECRVRWDEITRRDDERRF